MVRRKRYVFSAFFTKYDIVLDNSNAVQSIYNASRTLGAQNSYSRHFFRIQYIEMISNVRVHIIPNIGDAGLEPALFGAKNQRFTD